MTSFYTSGFGLSNEIRFYPQSLTLDNLWAIFNQSLSIISGMIVNVWNFGMVLYLSLLANIDSFNEV